MSRLTDHLCMGVAASAADLPAAAHLLHQEPVGAQWAWVARRQPGQAATPVQLELLYKALSLSPQPVLAALEAAVATARLDTQGPAT